MANLNLSEFGEKLFVADADHTFIWDTAASISKRVSRNSWLNSGTLTSDAPVTISQTWNGTGSTVFKALVVNATTPGTTSSSSSLLLDLQVGGVSLASINKTGSAFLAVNGSNTAPSLRIGAGAGINGWYSFAGLQLNAVVNSINAFGITTSGTGIQNGNLSFGISADLVIERDAANTLALRNGAAAQTFNVYNTYTDASNYSRLRMQTGSGFVQINAEGAGTGLQNSLYFNAGSTSNNGIISFRTKDVERWNIASAGHLLAGIDNTYDIGASGANRPRDIYAGGNGIFGGLISALNGFRAPSSSQLIASANGIWRLTNSSADDFNRLQFGGTTDVFPAIARDGAGIKFTGAAAGSTAWIKVPPVAVGSLPVAATAGAGARAFVNDASAPVFGTAVTGGGAVAVPVYSTGSAWNVG